MAASIDSVVLQIEAKLGQYNNEVAGAANATERALQRIDTAATNTEKTLGRNRIGMQQLSYQLGDMATMFALGARPMQIFASQSGQVLQAVQLMTGGTSKLASFLAGPWGIAILAATQVLVPFIGRLFETGEAAETAASKFEKAMESLRQSLPQMSEMSRAMTEATREIAKELGTVGQLNGQINTIKGALDAGGIPDEGVFALSRRLEQMERQRDAAQARAERIDRTMRSEMAAAATAKPIQARNEAALKPDKPDKPDRPRKAGGLSAEEIEARNTQALSRLQQEELSARADLADNARDRADLELEALRETYNQRAQEILNDKNFTDAQKRAQLAILDRLYGYLRSADGTVVAGSPGVLQQRITQDRNQRLEREAQELAEERHHAETEALENQYRLATTEAARRDIALQILDVEDAFLRSKLEAIRASETATEAERQRAAIAIEALNRTAGDRRDLVTLQHQGPLGRYADSLADPRTRVEEAVVRKLEAVNQGITDALTETLGIKDDFVKDLFSIFLDEVIFRPLAQSLQGASGSGGGLGGLLGTVFGAIFGFGGARANGGPVSAGTPYLVGERGRELFVPQSPGVVIPNHQLSGTAAGGGTVRVVIEEAPGFAARVRTEALGVAVEVHRATRPGVVAEAASGTMRAASRRRLP